MSLSDLSPGRPTPGFATSEAISEGCVQECSSSLVPPNLHLIVADNHMLQPGERQLEEALRQSRAYWYSVAAVAKLYHENGVKKDVMEPHHMLWKVPRLRGRPRHTYAVQLGASAGKTFCFLASTNWQLENCVDCEHVDGERTMSLLMQMGTTAAVPYTFNGTGFRHWIGTQDESAVGPNYLAILTLAWSYILSARLVEIQGEDATMQYMESKAPVNLEADQQTRSDIVDIGEVDWHVSVWWASILAPGEGWRAVVKQFDCEEFISPWSVAHSCNESYAIKAHRETSDRIPSSPLSSNEAFDALCQFAILHNLGSQVIVALTTAITIPTHNYYGTTLQLPRPTLTGARCPVIPPEIVPEEWTMLYENLLYYMTLSCSPDAVISSLCGMFWELDVPCNLVSPWLHPILNEVPSDQNIADTPAYGELLGIICGIRRPTISTLWLGAVAGALTPVILRMAGRGRPPLEPVAFPWTGCPQSFMDITGSGPYLTDKGQIWRADVWRLLHLPTAEEDEMSYNYRPHTPWMPCGKMKEENCALRVVAHMTCPRHHINYHHLTWELEDGRVVQDQGFSTALVSAPSEVGWDLPGVQELPHPPHKPLDQKASREASLDIFRWFAINGEGLPPENIYEDEWLDPLNDTEESSWEYRDDDDVTPPTERSDEYQDDDDRIPQRPQTEQQDRVGNWLHTIS